VVSVRGFVRVGPGEYLVNMGMVRSPKCRCRYCGQGFPDGFERNEHEFEHEKRRK